MKSFYTYCFFFLIFWTNPLYPQEGLSTFLENWVNSQPNQEIEVSIESLLIKYQNIRFESGDINDINKWQEFFFLSTFELDQIFSFLKNNDQIIDVIFLNRIKEISPQKAFFIRYKLLESEMKSYQTNTTKSEILSYVLIPKTNNLSDLKNRNKVRIGNSNINWFFQTEQDIEETNILDYISSGISFTKQKNKFFIGDYITQFGLGLSLFQGFQFSNISLINNQKNGFRIHTGSQENYFMRGLAFQRSSSSNVNIYSFISHNKSDARWMNNRISNLYLDGSHLSNSDNIGRKSVDITSVGIALNKKNNKISNTFLFHNHIFSNPLISYKNSYSKQSSISNTFSYISSGFVFHSEVNLDQYKYWSNLSTAHLSLGRNLYFKSFFGHENSSFKTYFRQIPDAYSKPEQLMGYQIEYFSKKNSLDFNYSRNKENRQDYDENIQQNYRVNLKFRLVNRNLFQINYHYKRKEEFKITDDSQSVLERLQFRLNLSLRGKWTWQQALQLKLNKENGIGLLNKFEYKSHPFNLKLGILVFQQNSGAFYFYESDVPGFGYLKGYFNNGMLWYGIIAYSNNASRFYFKARLINTKSVYKFGCSMGIRHTF